MKGFVGLQASREALLVPISTALAAGIFVLDLLAPAGMAIGILYLIPLLISFLSRRRTYILLFAGACTLLTILGTIYSPSDAHLSIFVSNHLMSLLVIWAATVLYLKGLRASLSQQLSDNQLEGIILSAMDGIITIDEDQRITLFNPAAEQMFRCPAAEAIGQPIDKFIPALFRGAHREHIQSFGKTNVTNRRMGTLRVITGLRANGEEFPIEASISQIQTPSGKFYSVIHRDITERKRSEDQFRQAVESSPSGMLMVDQSGKILLVNEQVEQQFGYGREELIGQPVEILVPERYRAQHPEHRAHFFAAPATRQMGKGRDLSGRRKDGSEFRVEIGLNPIRTAEGVRVLASVVDITERKQIEEQLRHTERLAELGTLASGMAHEIGTPMNVILGRAEYLMQRTNDEATRKGLSTIVTQVERITKVMNQLLAVARRRPVERRAVNLGQTIENNLEMVQERLARHGIQVEIAFADSATIILADADQMTQVFLNLIMNAIHAMPDGGVLRVGLGRADGQARITVADTGNGILPEDLPKIFDAFFTTKDTAKGTGLGLTVVKGIIEEHGGTITAESKPRHGTTFTITLPLEASR